jgi:hypothetical protein
MLTYTQVNEVLGVATAERLSPIISPRAMNMDFREGMETRHGVVHLQTIFEDETDREVFEKGVVQKVHPYQPYGLNPGGLVFLISGSVFFASVSGHWLYVKKLFTGLRSDLSLGWMVQAFEWFIIQNGVDNPVIWDGYNPAFQSDPSKQEMPVGSMMAFIHHQIAVASADGTDKIAVSDRWRQTESDNVWKFTGTTTWADGGVFGLHHNMGKLMAMVPIPQIKQTPNGQGDLLLMGSNGMQTLNLQVTPEDRINSQIQDTAMVGQGAASYLGVVPYRSGVWYVSHDGLHEFRQTQYDFYRSDADTHESGDVQFYWDNSNSTSRPTQPLGQYDNNILMGVLPGVEQNDFGYHRFCGAWSVVDLSERWKNEVRLPKRWNGIHAGIRPVEWVSVLINRINRTYCLSWDSDGKNRLYEMTRHLNYDIIEGKAKPIKSYFDTPVLTGLPKYSMVIKRPSKAKIDYDQAIGEVEINLNVRGETEACWHLWGKACAQPPSSASDDPCSVTPAHQGSAILSDPVSKPCFRPPPVAVRSRVHMTNRARIRNIIFGLEMAGGAADGFSPEMFLESCGSCATGKPSVSCCEELGLYSLTP